MNAQPNATARLEVPPTGGSILFTVVSIIVVFFVGVAVFNLGHSAALSPLEIGGSILWLCIVAAMLAFAVADAPGLRQFLVNFVGMFSRRAFIEVALQDDGPTIFRYGFEWLGREFDYSRIELARIGMVGWGAGQGSAISGRDRNDWTVAVWYWKSAPTGPWNRYELQDKDLIIVTPYLPKHDAAAIGRSIIALLSDAGVRLLPGDEENDFMVAHAQNDDAQVERSESAP